MMKTDPVIFASPLGHHVLFFQNKDILCKSKQGILPKKNKFLQRMEVGGGVEKRVT